MSKDKRLYMDVHVLQTLPPSNVNRDDTGSPKTAQYGGVRRARVSSQSWKKAMRDYFREFAEEERVGVRTLEVVSYVRDKIVEIDPNYDADKAFELAEKTLNAADVKTKEHKAKALFFMGDHQAKALAKAAMNGQTDKKELKQILKSEPDIDIALFGRMVADDPSLNEDASCQVAHAISTHAVQTEFDYFTAMDDLSPEDQAGAGMLGSIEYNSSTMYRYANVGVHALMNQLGKEELVKTLNLFIKAFSNSMPTGKVNTFANQTLPQMLVVVLRGDRPVNLVSAFEEPIKSNQGYVGPSVERFAQEFARTQKFVEEPLGVIYMIAEENESMSQIGEEAQSFNELLQMLDSTITTLL